MGMAECNIRDIMLHSTGGGLSRLRAITMFRPPEQRESDLLRDVLRVWVMRAHGVSAAESFSAESRSRILARSVPTKRYHSSRTRSSISSRERA